MSTNKILIAGLIGGVAAFILGALFYGLLLGDFMKSNAGSATGVERAPEEIVWWAMIIGHLAWGFLFSVIYGRWANISTFVTGAKAGGVIGLLLGLGYDLIWYGTSNVMNLTATFVDVFVTVVMSALIGGIVAWWLGRK